MVITASTATVVNLTRAYEDTQFFEAIDVLEAATATTHL